MSKEKKLAKKEAKLAKKEAKKAKKAKNGNEVAENNLDVVSTGEKDKAQTETIFFKKTLVKCIAFALATIMVCISVSSCVNKYSDAIKEAGKYPNRAGSFVQNVVAGSDGQAGGSATDAPSADGTTDDAVLPDDTGAADTEAPSADANDPTKAPASGEMTKAQIIDLFNKAANGAKTNAKSITQNYCKNSQVSSIELKNKTLASVADKLIAANMGDVKEKHNVTYKGADKQKFFPAAGQTWSSKLTEADVKNATVKKAGNTYVVKIELVDDTTPNIVYGQGHAGKAFSIVTKQQIVDGAGSLGMKFIDESSIKVNFRKSVINATIDANTGKLLKANYYYDWRLALTALKIDVAIWFGIEEDFKINW